MKMFNMVYGVTLSHHIFLGGLEMTLSKNVKLASSSNFYHVICVLF
jgi:hypothetical protein